jgi:hypothetical protein
MGAEGPLAIPGYLFVATTEDLTIPGRDGVVEFSTSTSTPPNTQNIEFPSLLNPIVVHYDSTTGRIQSFLVTVEGDYLVGLFGSGVSDSGFTNLELAVGGTFTPGSGTTTGTLTGATFPFFAGPWGGNGEFFRMVGMFHFTVGQEISFQNVIDQLTLSGGGGTTASAFFQLLRAGPPAPSP